MTQLSASELKKLKELHVSNNLGGDKLTILLIGLNPILNILLFSILTKWLILREVNFTARVIIIEFLSLILPLLISIVFANHITFISIAITILIAILYLSLPKASTNNDKVKEKEVNNPKLKPYLTHYRSNLMLLTCICILAVDFLIFPKFLQKVETYGTSLMDVGVGAFVFSSGVVNSKQRTSNSSNFGLILKSFKVSLPLWIIGIFRLISVKGLEYQEHVTEYGVHWNFFFTLASLPPLTQLIDLIPLNETAKPWIIGISYQLLLTYTNLENFIINSPRTNLINMNREGIFSILGYLSIFLIGKTIGKELFNTSENSIVSNLIQKTIIYSLIDYTLSLVGIQNSRRMANLPYITWVTSFNLSLILIFYIIDKNPQLSTISIILDSLNFNSLLTFLWANILTGLTNMSVNTLEVSNFGAFIILVGYLMLVLALPLILFRLKIKVI